MLPLLVERLREFAAVSEQRERKLPIYILKAANFAVADMRAELANIGVAVGQFPAALDDCQRQRATATKTLMSAIESIAQNENLQNE